MKKFVALVVGLAMLVCLGGCVIEPDPNGDTETQGKINEVVSDKYGVSYCVTSVDNLKTIGSGIWEETTEYNFVVLSITITNNGKEPYDANALKFVLVCDGREYEYATNGYLTYDNIMSSDTINPGITKEFRLVYETPTATTESEYKLRIDPDYLSDINSVYITLK